MPSQPMNGARRGSVIVIVLWTIAVAAIITSSVQLFGYRQAVLGRESLERVQARWAARSGVENTIAVMTLHTEKPFPDDAKAMARDMWYVCTGDTLNASYEIIRDIGGVKVGGPEDEHSKININRMEDRGLLMLQHFDDMSFDLVDAINDWTDEDDEASTLGVERDYYLSLDSPYEPRNGPIHSVGEVEMIAGVWPKYFRGEDWNLNGRLDPNENDGDYSFPPDQPDDELELGWAHSLTVYSRTGGATMSGQPRLHLRTATSEELVDRLGVETAQAEALIQYGSSESASLTDLLFTNLGSQNVNSGGTGNNEGNANAAGQTGTGTGSGRNTNRNSQGSSNAGQLTRDQLKAVLAETSVEDPKEQLPGKMNINTIPTQFLRDIFIEGLSIDEAIVDEIIYMREGRPQGIPSLVDLMDIPNITDNELRNITRRFDTVSNVFTINSRGRSAASGMEVEIIAVVDRSTVPVRILEYREQ